MYLELTKNQSSSGVTQWIGATDAGHEGNWTWTDGSPVNNSAQAWL